MSINSDPKIHHQVICANVFVRKDDKYLVLKRSPEKKVLANIVHPIGGKVEPDENPYIAAKREVAEEAGIEVKNMRLEAVILEIKPEVNDPIHNWLIFHFSADYSSGEVKQTEEGELIWLTPQEIKEQNLFLSVQLTIDHILDKDIGTLFATIEYDEAKKAVIKSQIDLCALRLD